MLVLFLQTFIVLVFLLCTFLSLQSWGNSFPCVLPSFKEPTRVNVSVYSAFHLLLGQSSSNVLSCVTGIHPRVQNFLYI